MNCKITLEFGDLTPDDAERILQMYQTLGSAERPRVKTPIGFAPASTTRPASVIPLEDSSTLLTTTDVARLSGVDRSNLAKLVREGRIAATKRGPNVRSGLLFEPAEVERWLASRRPQRSQKSPPPPAPVAALAPEPAPAPQPTPAAEGPAPISLQDLSAATKVSAIVFTRLAERGHLVIGKDASGTRTVTREALEALARTHSIKGLKKFLGA